MEIILECSQDPVQQEDLELAVKSGLPWELLAGKTVFVTGATGLVGGQIIKTLLAANRLRELQIRVIALVRSAEKAERIFGHLLERPELSLCVGDVLEPLRIDENVDFIIHAASQTASKEFVTHPVQTIDISFLGTKNVLELARVKQARMVYLSSMEAYGNPTHGKNLTGENDLGFIDHLNVRSCYSEGKRFCECLCACYAFQYGVEVSIARLAQTFGAGVSDRETRVFVQFARAAMEGTDVVLHTPGQSYGNYCYTADAVCGILTVLLKGERAEAYNVVSEAATMKIAEMAALVTEKIAGGKIRVVFDIPESTLVYGYAPDVTLRLDGSKLRRLGWNPVIAPELEAMYRRMIASFQSQKEM